jgi:hypothetical protein
MQKPFLLCKGMVQLCLSSTMSTRMLQRLRKLPARAANVNDMHWPAKSPDKNPVEQILDELGRRVRCRHASRTVNELANALVREWYNLPYQLVQLSLRKLDEKTY